MRQNPYSRGCLSNCAEMWCTRVPPSHINFRAYLDEVERNQPPPEAVYAPSMSEMSAPSTIQGPGARRHGATAAYVPPPRAGEWRMMQRTFPFSPPIHIVRKVCSDQNEGMEILVNEANLLSHLCFPPAQPNCNQKWYIQRPKLVARPELVAAPAGAAAIPAAGCAVKHC